jgi:hypothetical protein
MEYYRRNIDQRQRGQLGLDTDVTIVAGDIAVAVAIRVDYDIHEIGVLERCGSTIECSLIEHQVGDQSRQQSLHSSRRFAARPARPRSV